MNKLKLKLAIIVICISVPVIFLLNQFLFYIMPSSITEGEKVIWFSTWSSALSFVSVLIIIAALYRYFSTRGRK